MKTNLQGFSKSKAVKALKIQINTQTKILKQPAEKSLFMFSKDNKKLSLYQLKTNLVKLMESSMSKDKMTLSNKIALYLH